MSQFVLDCKLREPLVRGTLGKVAAGGEQESLEHRDFRRSDEYPVGPDNRRLIIEAIHYGAV